MSLSHDVIDPATDSAPAAKYDDDSSSLFSGDSDDNDDSFFADDMSTVNDTSTIPQWQTLYPAQYSKASRQESQLPDDNLAHRSFDIYREVVILDYRNGNGDSPWIRLLQIRPDTMGQPLHCKLIKRPLWDAGEYLALSYSWGKGREQREIHINGQNVPANSFRVSTHLWNALQRLRDEKRGVNVWIDAICIDQQNYVERAAQVNIMAQIFNQASEVRVWLGEGEFLAHGVTTDVELFWYLCQQPSPWWTRLWILQEFAYAEHCPIVMLGADLMSFKRLIERWGSATQLGSELDVAPRKILMDNFELLRTPFDIWTAQKNDQKHRLPLLQRLRETANRKCTDPRDRIYALLSLIEENEAAQLRPDYRKPYPELVLELAEMLRQSPSWNERRDNAVLTNFRPGGAVGIVLRDDSTAQDYGLALAQALHDENPKLMLALLRRCANFGTSQLPKANAIHNPPQPTFKEAMKLLTDDLAVIDTQIYTSALDWAIEWGDEKVVERLNSVGGNFNARHLNPVNALQAASIKGQEKIVQMLINAGANANATGGDYGSLLQHVSYQGHEKVVSILIDAGADVNARGGIYGNALQAAAYQGHEKVVRILIDFGADCNIQGGIHGNALQAAAYQGFEKVIRILIDAGASGEGGLYGNALQAASLRGHERTVEMLVEKGADVNAKGGRFGYALQAASLRGNKKIVEMLMIQGANVNARGGEYGNALNAAKRGNNRNVVKMLIDAGAVEG